MYLYIPPCIAFHQSTHWPVMNNEQSIRFLSRAGGGLMPKEKGRGSEGTPPNLAYSSKLPPAAWLQSFSTQIEIREISFFLLSSLTIILKILQAKLQLQSTE